ncbi:sialidase family protein [Paenibacillus ginsengarvi]|uniref:Neuraminidase (Sialidase) n=1 Tax=Paenibacillus ginsengarvi TaxID=400777 RepID=A0A3B0CJX8_9BACL|nr:sialidase family protein [Paenibacillus ginsengarvi]RKN84844.1 neuraminidase (sialidase) [Paenibacillus ginsengarvi]
MHTLSAEKEIIFEKGKFFESCHASSVLVLPSGDVLAAWFAGTREGADDVGIWLARRSGGVWSDPQVVADENDLPHWNPVLFLTASGTVQLYYKVGKKIPQWQTRIITSQDGGLTWSEPKELVPGDFGGRGPVRCKPIYTKDGKLVAPASVETKTEWDAFVDLSDDDGQTWTKSSFVPVDHSTFPQKGIIQPTLWETSEGLHMLVRTSAAEIYRSDSADGGRTWTPAYPIGLPNNNSGIDIVQLDDGRLVLIFNPVGLNWGARSPLILRMSEDNGKTWGIPFALEKEEGEYSYPALVAEGRTLHLTYTWKRETVAYWKIELE